MRTENVLRVQIWAAPALRTNSVVKCGRPNTAEHEDQPAAQNSPANNQLLVQYTPGRSDPLVGSEPISDLSRPALDHHSRNLARPSHHQLHDPSPTALLSPGHTVAASRTAWGKADSEIQALKKLTSLRTRDKFQVGTQPPKFGRVLRPDSPTLQHLYIIKPWAGLGVSS